MSSIDLTACLAQLQRGDPAAAAELWPLVYQQLRRLAEGYFQGEPTHSTLQPTALVHEAYLRLAGNADLNYRGRAEFFALAAQVMRRILIDHARRRAACKRGGRCKRIELDAALHWTDADNTYFLGLDEALGKLAAQDAQLARLVELRFFAGLSFDELAEALQVAPITAKRLWKLAKAWLHREMTRGEQKSE